MFNEEFAGLPENVTLYVDERRENFKFEQKVMPFEDQGIKDTVVGLTKNTEAALQAFFSANIFVSIFSASMLQYLWSLINTLQIVVLTVLFKLPIPLNAELIMTMILQMCALEFIPTAATL